MPRRKAADRAGLVHKRSRSGCNSCRVRKVKCDESRPQCRNCVARGLTCDNRIRLKWEEEFVADGRAFGREGVWGKGEVRHRRARTHPGDVRPDWPLECSAVLPIEPHHFINVFVRNLQGDSACRGEHDAMIRQEDSASNALFHGQRRISRCNARRPDYHAALLSSPVLPNHFDGFDPDLLDYYFFRLCPLTTPSRRIISPFSDLILPLFANGGQTFTMQSILAFTARHRSLNDPRWSAIALSLKGKALSALRHRITSHDAASGLMTDPQIPIAMVFLCLDEILDNCDHRWVIHMRACQSWLRRRKQLASPGQSGPGRSLVLFAERFFASQDVISRTACGKASHFGLDYWERSEGDLDPGWSGCSPALAGVMFRVTELGRVRAHGGTEWGVFEGQAASLEKELDALKYGAEYDRQDDQLRNIFDMTLEAVRVYHHCLLYDATPETPIIANSIGRILQLAQGLVHSGCVSGLAFSIFIAAVELDPLRDEVRLPIGGQGSGRRLVVEMLQELAGSALFNVAKIRAVIQDVWASRDLSLEEEQEVGRENDWNYHVSPHSSNISLA